MTSIQETGVFDHATRIRLAVQAANHKKNKLELLTANERSIVISLAKNPPTTAATFKAMGVAKSRGASTVTPIGARRT